MARAAATHGLRSVFISDLHLGSYRCNAPALSNFLARTEPEALYLVGDILDVWALRPGATLPSAHQDVARRIFELARIGTRVVLIPGNHDDVFLRLADMMLPGIEVRRDCIVETGQGARYLVIHGHEQDAYFGSTGYVARVGSRIGERVGEIVHAVVASRREAERRPTAGRRLRVKRLVSGASRFEQALAAEARSRGADGVICGHLHVPADADIDGVHYLNCGDWLRHCSAVTEDATGAMNLQYWPQRTDVTAPAAEALQPICPAPDALEGEPA